MCHCWARASHHRGKYESVSCFQVNKILINHRRTHTGERPFQCEYCSAAFAQKSAMNTHFIHTGERPLSCEICGCTFRQNASLYTHKKRVHKIYPEKKRIELVKPSR
ncbi:hypothetical protein K1T71_000710 [Dendrolimus kikuchii]|uniref:Uncharacterized protein n=1 Tax=Dendrolimus kikuchii TaxID=765133 RepID=A0ACC1DKS1_9NEOP|nr:hypothetical protein K1T71_000710 [Dendrolimus kikuchii]